MASAQGMISLRNDGMLKVLNGDTSLEEVPSRVVLSIPARRASEDSSRAATWPMLPGDPERS